MITGTFCPLVTKSVSEENPLLTSCREVMATCPARGSQLPWGHEHPLLKTDKGPCSPTMLTGGGIWSQPRDMEHKEQVETDWHHHPEASGLSPELCHCTSRAEAQLQVFPCPYPRILHQHRHQFSFPSRKILCAHLNIILLHLRKWDGCRG